MKEVTTILLHDMSEIAREQSANFIVVLLDLSAENRKYYREFLEHSEIELIDGYHPDDSKMRIPGDGHPNAALDEYWAEQIKQHLREQSINEKP